LGGRHKYSWKDNIKMDVKEIGYEGVVCAELAQVRSVSWLLVPYEARNFLTR